MRKKGIKEPKRTGKCYKCGIKLLVWAWLYCEKCKK